MKSFKLILYALLGAFFFTPVLPQNVMINVLTQNAGVVSKGKTIYVEVTINNTDPNVYLGIYRIQAKISVPAELVTISATGHVLPTGWTITANNGSTITLSNGKNMIASNDARTLLIAVQGKKTGGPSTISGQLLFSNGEPPGTAPGSLTGEMTGDNTSTTTIKVVR